ncbi:antitoxin Xre/MbcA/ParS toxin-binding domain-containing protein [Pseudoalteromonas tetraodonis]|uniref:antitoxin Xre/MbcA/ParS toxin-binding domain-containing protein n=1 Tax=Pseudoalteromonas tetraodonis TaxID=43659 RepID=UPI003D08D00D
MLLLNITFSGFEVCMPSDIQPSANHKFVDILSNGKVTLSSNPLDEIELIQCGLDIKSVEKFRLQLRWDIQSFAKAIGANTRTFESHKKEHKRLNATLSENTFELAHLASTCIDYFESIERWNKWLNTCSLQFSSKTPLTFVNTIAGRRLIRNVVNSLKYGYNA